MSTGSKIIILRGNSGSGNDFAGYTIPGTWYGEKQMLITLSLIRFHRRENEQD